MLNLKGKKLQKPKIICNAILYTMYVTLVQSNKIAIRPFFEYKSTLNPRCYI